MLQLLVANECCHCTMFSVLNVTTGSSKGQQRFHNQAIKLSSQLLILQLVVPNDFCRCTMFSVVNVKNMVVKTTVPLAQPHH